MSSIQRDAQNLLGAILVRHMELTLNTLQSALDRQKITPRPLGEILLDMGAIDEEQLQRALQIQAENDSSGRR